MSIILYLMPIHQLCTVPQIISAFNYIEATVKQRMNTNGLAVETVRQQEQLLRKVTSYRHKLVAFFLLQIVFAMIPSVLYWILRLPLVGWVIYLVFNVLGITAAFYSFAFAKKNISKNIPVKQDIQEIDQENNQEISIFF